MKLTSGMGAVLIAVFLAVSIVVFAFLYKPKVSLAPDTTVAPNAVAKLTASIADIDSDGDGLKDWEESLWGTDPLQKDSDKDGTEDGKEVESGRNPKIAGPKDKLDLGSPETASQIPKTGTEEFGQEFLNEYFSARQSGEIDAEKRDQIVSNIISKTALSKTRVYTEGDVTTSADNSEPALRTYANLMGEAIFRHAVKNENELSILQRAMTEKRPRELEKLDPTIAAYKGTLEDMLRISVPNSVLSIHLEILSSVSAILKTVTDFRNAYTDPVSTLVSANGYLGTIERLVNAFRDASDWFKEKKMAFSEKEYGYLFLNLLP